jgi:hypothetical protein
MDGGCGQHGLLTAKQIFLRSLKVFAAFALADAIVAAVVFALSGWPNAHELYGDVGLFCMSLLLLAGGFYDWSQAEWGVGFRRLTGNRDARYEGEAHREADRKGIALIAAAAWLFLLQVAFEMALALAS